MMTPVLGSNPPQVTKKAQLHLNERSYGRRRSATVRLEKRIKINQDEKSHQSKRRVNQKRRTSHLQTRVWSG